jgi:predicted RNase H-like HicB family nuclease
MEKIIKLKIQKLPEGVFLATSDDIQGLVAQASTLQETIEIAQDLAKTLLELQKNNFESQKFENEFELPLVVGY